MLRVKGKSLKEQLKDLEKDPSIALTTGRPVKPVRSDVKRGYHPGLRPNKVEVKTEVKSERKTIDSTAKRKSSKKKS